MSMSVDRRRLSGASWLTLAIVAVLGCSILAVSSVTQRVATSATPAFGVYLQPDGVPADSQLPIATIQDMERERGFIHVTSAEALVSEVQRTNAASIWIHAAALDSVPIDWLDEQKRRGAVIVGIEMSPATLHSSISMADGALNSDWNPQDYLTWVVYAELPHVDFTNEHGEPASLAFHAFNNLRFEDPADPSLLVEIVNTNIDKVNELLSYRVERS